MSDRIALLSAFGVGTVVSALIQSVLSERREKEQRAFAERKEAYVGLLEAYHRAAVENTDEASKKFAYWHLRCELVAPEGVRLPIENIIQSNADRHGRSAAHHALQREMRKDLGIGK